MITEILSGLWIGNLDELTNTQFFKDNSWGQKKDVQSYMGISIGEKHM